MSKKKEYTFEEDTMITARAAVSLVRTTREGVDPVPFVAALLEGYARRVQTKYNSSAVPRPLSPSGRGFLEERDAHVGTGVSLPKNGPHPKEKPLSAPANHPLVGPKDPLSPSRKRQQQGKSEKQ